MHSKHASSNLDLYVSNYIHALSSTPSLAGPLSYRIGVDVGGTNTDAVLLLVSEETAQSPDRGIKATHKHPTTPDVNEGIEKSISAVLTEAGVKPSEVGGVMIGTTHFINAVISSDISRLSRVAVLRLGFPYTTECPPFIDFPPHLRRIIQGYWAVISGGRQIDGSAISPVDERQVRMECTKIKERGLSVVVLVGVYSPLEKDGFSQEDRVRDIIEDELGLGVDVVCSRDIGPVGLLERENASILNASILRFARHTVLSFHRAISTLGLNCPLYITQNDGTLTTAASASRLPIKTFASGATNSMRGASYLAGLRIDNAIGSGGQGVIVVDIGGTSTDVGVLQPSGFPRQAAAFIEVGGVRTNFAMPDVQSIALGGGSIVRFTKREGRRDSYATIGPDSVGLNLLHDAIVFGGSTPTATDIIVATASHTQVIGGASNVVDHFSATELEQAQGVIKSMLEAIIDKMKISPEPVKVLLVGGGSIIAPPVLEGVAELIQPLYFSCANAVGAAVASISGEVDTIEILENHSFEEIIKPLKEEAIWRAIRAGAKPETVQIVEIDNLPVQYVTNKATRIIIRAVGDLDITLPKQSEPSEFPNSANTVPYTYTQSMVTSQPIVDDPSIFLPTYVKDIDIDTYCPKITQGEWLLSEIDLEWIQEGCGVLGAGGGGSPFPPYLMAREILRDGGVIRVIDSNTLPDEAIILRGHFMGSPSVSNERLQSGREIETAVQSLLKYMGVLNAAAVISDEIGGGNGIQPMILGSKKHLNLPIFDGDLMGRAYPNMYQSLPAAFDIPNSLTPCAIADGVGNSVILPSTSDKFQVETILRNVCTTLGSKAGVSMAPLTAKICCEFGVVNTVSQAWRIGRTIAQCRTSNNIKGVPSAITGLQTGDCIFIGKIVSINREVRAGFTWGSVYIMSLHEDEEKSTVDDATSKEQLHITFQNEFLVALLEYQNGIRKPVAVVPDLITVIDTYSGSSLGTHELRYGLRVTCIVLAGDPKWTTPQGLACGGPEAFGLDVPWFSLGTYKKPRSVIEEYHP